MGADQGHLAQGEKTAYSTEQNQGEQDVVGERAESLQTT